MTKPSILLVDDDPISIATLEHYLNDIAQIYTSNNGEDAISLIKKLNFDLIVLDMIMPGLTGIDICKYIKGLSKYANIPIIFISAVDDISGKVQGLLAGAVDYITKPFICQEVKLRIRTHIDLYLLRKNLELQVKIRTSELTETIVSLKKAQSQILRTEKLASLGTLASGIAHEVNSPVQFIGDNLTYMQTAVIELKSIYDRIYAPQITQHIEGNSTSFYSLISEMWQAIDESLDGVARVRNIVQAVNMFAHPGTASKGQHSAKSLIQTAISVTRNSWKNICKINVQIEQDIPSIPCNSSDIIQVLVALIINAVDAIQDSPSAGNGQIILSVKQLIKELEFSVSDNGCGIPDHIRPHIWDMFFTTKEPGSGSGQGLAICHNIITIRHCGLIDFESTHGIGSCFYFRLPIADNQSIHLNVYSE